MTCLLFGVMRVSNPGGLLALFAILAPLVLGWAIYAHWWPIAALFAPIALCHIGLLFRIRPAAYVLLAAYILGSVFLVVSFFNGTSTYPTWWRLALKLSLNLAVIHELWQWLRRRTALDILE